MWLWNIWVTVVCPPSTTVWNCWYWHRILLIWKILLIWRGRGRSAGLLTSRMSSFWQVMGNLVYFKMFLWPIYVKARDMAKKEKAVDEQVIKYFPPLVLTVTMDYGVWRWWWNEVKICTFLLQGICRKSIPTFTSGQSRTEKEDVDMASIKYIHSYVCFPSKLLWHWFNNILLTGYRKCLTLEDLGQVPRVQISHFFRFSFQKHIDLIQNIDC